MPPKKAQPSKEVLWASQNYYRTPVIAMILEYWHPVTKSNQDCPTDTKFDRHRFSASPRHAGPSFAAAAAAAEDATAFTAFRAS
mmetsp:Transcript_41999/g.83089  ORF Transcript_41999/g.83089 Transcript_41999/m.83089 type:complete len:84 (+) Transcript_41999:159-410(+)